MINEYNKMKFEDELLLSLTNKIGKNSFIVKESSDEYFMKLASFFPVLGSKINWKKVVDSIEETCSDSYNFIDFFADVCKKFNLKGDCIVIGDSAIDCAIIMSIDTLRDCLTSIIEIPQHHYFIADDFSWCISYTMEENMAFGYSNCQLK